MPTDLTTLPSVTIRGRLVGAYDEEYLIEELNSPVSGSDILRYVLEIIQGGGSTGDNDVIEGSGIPTTPPGAGEPYIYQNTDTGDIYVWDGSSWNLLVNGDGENDITEAASPPTGAPATGEPLVHQNTNNGALYIWDGSQWVLVGGSENEITEGSGPPSGTPGTGAPVIYLDEDSGNVWTWDGSQWNVLGVIASNGLTKTANDVELGGSLERNTAITGSDLYAFIWNALTTHQINVAPQTNETIRAWASEFAYNIRRVYDTDYFQDMFMGTPLGAGSVPVPESTKITFQNLDLGNGISALFGSDQIGQVFMTVSDGTDTIGFSAEVVPGTGALRLNIITPNVSDGSAVAGQVLTLSNETLGSVEFQDAGAATGLFQYEAAPVNTGTDEGALVTATGQSITYERVGGSGTNTEGVVSVPAGTILRGVTVHFDAAQAPGNTFYLNVDYQNTGRDVNGGQNSVMPPLGTVTSKPAPFSDASPATNYVHSGTPLQIGIAQVDDNGTRTRVRYKITNYSQQVGANPSMLTLIFP